MSVVAARNIALWAGLRLPLAFTCVAGAPANAGKASPPPQTLTPGAEQPTGGTATVKRILFLGNSITQHGPSAKVSWTGNWGMAASAAERDYVHLVAAGIAERTGKAPAVMASNVAGFERHFVGFDAQATLKAQLAFGADVVILAIGENVPELAADEAREAFRKSLTALVTAFRQAGHPRLFVRSSFWPDPVKDRILQEVCAACGGTFVDISAMAKDERNHARSERHFEHAGVAAHPGDRGMRAIADALLAAISAEPGPGQTP